MSGDKKRAKFLQKICSPGRRIWDIRSASRPTVSPTSRKSNSSDPSKWQIFKNTHEAIIDQETFDVVQHIRDVRRRWTPMGEMPILSGMVFCADCGSKLYQVRGRNLPQSEYMVCATYRKKGKHVCTSHQIRNSVIEEQLLECSCN